MLYYLLYYIGYSLKKLCTRFGFDGLVTASTTFIAT